MSNTKQQSAVSLRMETVLDSNNQPDTNYLVKLPEYKTEVIIRSQHVADLIEQLTILKKAQDGK